MEQVGVWDFQILTPLEVFIYLFIWGQ